MFVHQNIAANMELLIEIPVNVNVLQDTLETNVNMRTLWLFARERLAKMAPFDLIHVDVSVIMGGLDPIAASPIHNYCVKVHLASMESWFIHAVVNVLLGSRALVAPAVIAPRPDLMVVRFHVNGALLMRIVNASVGRRIKVHHAVSAIVQVIRVSMEIMIAYATVYVALVIRAVIALSPIVLVLAVSLARSIPIHVNANVIPALPDAHVSFWKILITEANQLVTKNVSAVTILIGLVINVSRILASVLCLALKCA